MDASEAINQLIDGPAYTPAADSMNDLANFMPALHPLAQFADLDGEVQAPRWIIPGFIEHGVVAIAGAHGVGKTTALLPLSMVAAGLCAGHEDLRPKHWRHVVYITEDVPQARRILLGLVRHGGFGIDMEDVKERVHLVEARRLDPARMVKVGKVYREQFTREVDGAELPPLVVIDTKSAVLEMDDENDNAQASRLIAMLKQDFAGLPVWLVGHLAKAQMNRTAARELSMRGGGAVEADANQTLYLVAEDDGTRYLARGKTRFEARWSELQINSDTATTQARDEFGGLEEITLRWGVAVPPEMSRKEAAQQAREQARKETDAEMRVAVLDAVQTAWQAGNPLSKTGARAKVPGKTQEVAACIERLLAEQWLVEVDVPAKERCNNSKKAFLVRLSTPEHEAVTQAGAQVPAEKLAIPPTWRKAIPVVPGPQVGKPDGGQV